MRHVGQKLRFVLGGQRQLLSFALECAARLLNFLVLAFHLNVLLRQLLSFLRQLLVRLLQFFLLGLQLGGQLLRLLQKSFGLHRGLYAVEHDTDAGCQLIEERELRSREDTERGQFNDRFDTVLEKDRKNDYIARGRFEQARADGDGVWRQIGDHHPPFFRSALAHESLTDSQSPEMPVMPFISKGGKRHHTLLLLSVHLIDNALLSIDQ